MNGTSRWTGKESGVQGKMVRRGAPASSSSESPKKSQWHASESPQESRGSSALKAGCEKQND